MAHIGLFSRPFHSQSVQLEVMDVANVDLHFSYISDAEINEETSRRFTKPVTEVNNYYLRAVGRKVLWSSACVCLSVCLSVRTLFVRKISEERVHGSPPNLVGGSRG